MMEDGVCCQVCVRSFGRVHDLQQHVRSKKHNEKMTEIFKKEKFSKSGNLPYIIVLRLIKDKPFVGMSTLTLCFSVDRNISFYLCHVCAEKCPPNRIGNHVYSRSHYSNYLNYTDPNALTFSWMPGMVGCCGRVSLSLEVKRKIFASGFGQLQILDLPTVLLHTLERGTYAAVMNTLTENDKLLEQMAATLPKRMTIQAYQKDSQRKHPLLGLQHIIECVSFGPPEKIHYLCTLCKLTLSSHTIIKHILSLDHLHCYFTLWHPSTLLAKECYKALSGTLHSMMLDFAKQTEEINGTVNAHIKQVVLKPEEFASVNFSSYAEALKAVDSIPCEDKKSSLIVVVKPGKKLERRVTSAVPAASAAPAVSEVPAVSATQAVPVVPAVSATQAVPVVPAVSATPAAPVVPAVSATPAAPVVPAVSATPAAPVVPAVSATPAVPVVPAVSATPAVPVVSPALSYKISCQDCKVNLNTMAQFLKHVSMSGHIKILEKYFNRGGAGYGHKHRAVRKVPTIGLYTYIKDTMKQSEPAIGVSLVVVCICTEAQVEPLYLCFACKECFPEYLCQKHLNSQKHLIHTLLYQDPWRLPFAWEDHLDVQVLRSVALEEERKRGPNQMLLKILDVPYSMFMMFNCSYPDVMKVLQLYHSLLMRGVPCRETYSKLKENERYPLLGDEFLVMHYVSDQWHQSRDVAFLCLLCEKKLSGIERYAHVFSRKHVASFLNHFHPGSLNPNTDAEILDLAKQAARLHCISHLQVIEIEIQKPYTYERAVSILASVKRSEGKGQLCPRIIPKRKLVPRNIRDHGHERENCLGTSQNVSEKQVAERTTLKTVPVEVGPEISRTHDAGSGDNVEDRTGKDNLRPREESIKRSEMLACNETSQVIEEKKAEEPIKSNPNLEAMELFQDTEKVIKDVEEERGSGTTIKPKDESKNKRTSIVSAKSQKDTCAKIEDSKRDQKRQWLTPTHDLPLQDPQNRQNIEQKVMPPTDKGEGVTASHKTVKETDIKALKAQQNPELAPPSAVSTVQHMDVDKREVEEMEINSEDKEEQPVSVNASLSVKIESTSSAKDFAHPPISRSSEDPPSLRVSLTSLHSDSTENASTSDSAVTTSAKSITAISNCPARCQSSAAKIIHRAGDPRTPPTNSKSRETQCRLVATNTSVTRNPTKRPAGSPDSSRPSKMNKISNSEFTSNTVPQTVTSSIKFGNTVRELVKPNTDVIQCRPAAPVSTSSENKNSTKQPSDISACKTSKGAATVVGINQLIIVKCNKKQQIYCQLCSVKLISSSHLSDCRHKYNYVKMFFGISDKLPVDILEKVVTNLSEAEKNIGSQKFQSINVNNAIYEELHKLPEKTAIARLKEMLRQKDTCVSSSTSNTANEIPFTSPYEASSPVDELDFTSTEDGNRPVDQSDGADATRRSEANQSPDPLHSCPILIRNEPEQLAATGDQDERLAAVEMEPNNDGVCPAATGSEAAGTFAQIIETLQNNAEARLHQERSDPDLHDSGMLLEDTWKTSPEQLSSRDRVSSAASVSTEQNQPRPSSTLEQFPNYTRYSPGPSCSTTWSWSSISIGERIHTSSNLCLLLMVNQKPVIGLSSVWECRGIFSSHLPSFYLCESCREKISIDLICQHMVSHGHYLSYAMKQYHGFMHFWQPYLAKKEIFEGVVKMLSQQESKAKVDARVVLLRKDLYECVQAAPISQALKIVGSITKEPNLRLLRTLQEYGEFNQEHMTAMDANLIRTNRDALSHLDADSVSSMVAVSSLPGAASGKSPQATCRSHCVEPEPKQSVPQHQETVPELQVKQAGLRSQSSSTDSETSQKLSVSQRHECTPTRKRPAVTSLETLILPDTNNPSLMVLYQPNSHATINRSSCCE